MKTLFVGTSILVAALAAVPFSALAYGDDGYRYSPEVVRYSDRYDSYCCPDYDPAWEAVRDVTRFWLVTSAHDRYYDRHRHEYRHHYRPRHHKHHKHHRRPDRHNRHRH